MAVFYMPHKINDRLLFLKFLLKNQRDILKEIFFLHIFILIPSTLTVICLLETCFVQQTEEIKQNTPKRRNLFENVSLLILC